MNEMKTKDTKIYVNADPDTIVCNCQHPGNWGPWYHLSLYHRNPKTGKWKFVKELGRSGRGNNNYPYGRPGSNSTPIRGNNKEVGK